MFSYEITMQNNLKLCRNVLYEVFYKRSIFGSGWTNKLGRQRSQQIYFMVHLLYDWLNHTIATIGARILCRTHVFSHSIVCNGNIIMYRIEMPWIIPLYLWILFFPYQSSDSFPLFTVGCIFMILSRHICCCVDFFLPLVGPLIWKIKNIFYSILYQAAYHQKQR
jgi:hypothetical protein